MATPQLLSRKTNGHQSVTSSQSGPDASSKTSKAKAPVEGEKIVIRRLPPGLTEEEFVTILGDTWTAGNGKVGWFRYEKGKISTDPAKPSRPARAYLHVLRKDDLVPLSDAVRAATWEDAKESFASPSLVGPPAVEFSIYKKIPSGKRRADGRQGTIDQDPEFMAFLESLANPDATGQDGDQSTADEADKPAGKVKSTPLIESLREKKASKAKEAAAAKNAKHSRHDSQSKTKTDGDAKKGGGGKERSSDHKPKETVKILTKKAATDAAAEAAKTAASQIQQSKGDAQRDEAASKSRRAGIAAAARILQRDLGLSPGNAHRKARLDAAKAESEAKTAADKAAAPASTSAAAPSSPTTSRPSTPAAAKSQSQSPTAVAAAAAASSSTGRRGRRGRGGAGEDTPKGKADNTPSAPEKTPVILLKKKDDGAKPSPSPTTSTPSPTTTKQSPSAPKSSSTSTTTLKPPTTTTTQKKSSPPSQQPPAITPGATRAFVKHANPSQGVTEALLRSAMSVFGPVTNVEIDRRKGFAYVDFADAAGLRGAIAASPVSVGEEGGVRVVVLERREREREGGTPGGGRGKKVEKEKTSGGGGGGGGGGSAGAGVVEGGKAAEGSAASGEKRGGRRRGGRGRGGGERRDSPVGGGPKEGGGGGGGGGKKPAASGSGSGAGSAVAAAQSAS
ncbi:hypothetical protein CONLIGDRAFT_662413 [Coniochaeta ligniaria NRRL 30616]|uniref:RRM domain-containing protein n=1 Tax=Coniochaeta ligniaria NRRL 30616 TaxID=1408157 RepID=A0A1J7JC47_9PEZI|nr:hypothetical protein CONLIGDRAFT_662413 [Coniochaeta ligniaria NRRL 30616]